MPRHEGPAAAIHPEGHRVTSTFDRCVDVTRAAPPPRDDAVEEDLVRAARSGDQHAFRKLWRGAERHAYAICLNLCGNRSDAADALQETQIAAWRNLHHFEGRCSFAVWVYAIARNAARTVARSRDRRAEMPLPEDAPDLVAPVTSFSDTIADVLTVRQALQNLPEHHREALLLWVAGISYQAIAELLGVPVNSVRVWIHRARTKLRTQLG